MGGTAHSHGITPSPWPLTPWGTLSWGWCGLGRGEVPKLPHGLWSGVLDEEGQWFAGIKSSVSLAHCWFTSILGFYSQLLCYFLAFLRPRMRPGFIQPWHQMGLGCIQPWLRLSQALSSPSITAWLVLGPGGAWGGCERGWERDGEG